MKNRNIIPVHNRYKRTREANSKKLRKFSIYSLLVLSLCGYLFLSGSKKQGNAAMTPSASHEAHNGGDVNTGVTVSSDASVDTTTVKDESSRTDIESTSLREPAKKIEAIDQGKDTTDANIEKATDNDQEDKDSGKKATDDNDSLKKENDGKIVVSKSSHTTDVGMDTELTKKSDKIDLVLNATTTSYTRNNTTSTIEKNVLLNERMPTLSKKHDTDSYLVEKSDKKLLDSKPTKLKNLKDKGEDDDFDDDTVKAAKALYLSKRETLKAKKLYLTKTETDITKPTFSERGRNSFSKTNNIENGEVNTVKKNDNDEEEGTIEKAGENDDKETKNIILDTKPKMLPEQRNGLDDDDFDDDVVKNNMKIDKEERKKLRGQVLGVE